MSKNINSSHRVLVTNGSSRTSYAVLRSLSKFGIACFSADVSRFGMCQASRFSKGHFLYTSHYVSEDKFISDLVRLVEEYQITILFPSHNETEIIARHRHKFNSLAVSAIPAESHCRIFNNKSQAYDLAEKLGIPVPTRIHYAEPQEISPQLISMGIEKTVIKLLTGNSGKGVFYGDSPEHTRVVVEQLIEDYELEFDRYPQVEEYVEGEGYGNSVLYWHGDHITNFTHKRLRDKIETGGTSVYREASSHEGIESAAQEIFNSIGWHGLAMCEFKICPTTEKFWFIEVNPRMWGSIPLAIAAGVDFPYLTYLCASGDTEEAISHNNTCDVTYGWKGRWLLGELFLCLKNIMKGDFKTTRDILSKEKANSYDDFFWDDPIVFFGEIFAYLKNTASKRSINPSEKGMVG
ncbi:ATP-grasp domain-containing protein [Amylibacter sp.]|nr:ATP-grasp domain-containing protein [Amylibacter sp.]